MLEINYKPSFIKTFDSFETDLQDEILEKIAIFRNTKNHKQLKVHKLHGALKNYYSFYVNYEIRIVFEYLSKNEVVLVGVGGHNVYYK